MCIEICNLKRNLSYSAVSQCGTLPDWLVITIKHHLSIRANHAFFPLYPFIFFTANRLYVFQLSSFMILTESKLYNTGMTKKGWLMWNTKQNLHFRINFFLKSGIKNKECWTWKATGETSLIHRYTPNSGRTWINKVNRLKFRFSKVVTKIKKKYPACFGVTE
jgi:hypothetical protein